MAGDLHTHTRYSDGSNPVEQLPPMAAALGLSALAISDHDSILSVRYAHQNPSHQGVALIPATELTAFDPAHNRRVHLLVYYPDDCPALQAHCAAMAQRRHAAQLQSVAQLGKIHPQYTMEFALQYAKESGVLYKSGIMEGLRDLGLAGSIYGEEYNALFRTKGAQNVLHGVQYAPLEEVLALVRACRGVVVFAHPSVYKSMPLLRRLCAEGSIDGIEVYHPSNTQEDKAECLALAAQYGLIVTGGTDYHGANRTRPLPVGSCITTDEQIARIKALAAQRKR